MLYWMVSVLVNDEDGFYSVKINPRKCAIACFCIYNFYEIINYVQDFMISLYHMCMRARVCVCGCVYECVYVHIIY